MTTNGQRARTDRKYLFPKNVCAKSNFTRLAYSEALRSRVHRMRLHNFHMCCEFSFTSLLKQQFAAGSVKYVLCWRSRCTAMVKSLKSGMSRPDLNRNKQKILK